MVGNCRPKRNNNCAYLRLGDFKTENDSGLRRKWIGAILQKAGGRNMRSNQTLLWDEFKENPMKGFWMDVEDVLAKKVAK